MSAPVDETPQEPSETFRPQEPEHPPAKHAWRGLILGVSGLTVLVLLFALLFAALNHRSTASSGAPPTSPGWQRYVDPDGHFTVSIPNGWTVQRETSTATAGDSHGSVTFHNLMYTFGGPPRGQQTITVWIYVEPIENERARQWMCGAFFPERNNTTLAGLPAVTLGNGTWLAEGSGAHFQISYTYPNDPGDVLNQPTPTPMPPGFYEQGQQEWQAILASFMPMPDTPLKCP